MLKKIVFCFSLISFISYSCEPFAISKDVAGVASAMPDISPKAFGVMGDEVYIRALHDFAQVLLMQHRYFNAALKYEAVLEKYRGLNGFVNVGRMSRSELLNHAAHGQEIREALRAGKPHELLVKTQTGDYLFAETMDGIALLIKHRSLFMQDEIDLKHKPLIDKISLQGIEKNSFELIVMSEILRIRMERTQIDDEMRKPTKELNSCKMDVDKSTKHFRTRYVLSEQLSALLNLTPRLVNEVGGITLPIHFGRMLAIKQLIQQYESSQLPLYELIRKRLQELLIGAAKKDRKILVYSRTEQGELLPIKLDSFDSHEADVAKSTTKVAKSLDLVEQLKAKEAAAKEDQKKTKQKHKKQKHVLCIPQDSCVFSADPADVSKKHAVIDSLEPQAASTQAIDRQIPLRIVQTSKEAATAQVAQKIPAQLKDDVRALVPDAAAAADSSDMSYVIPDYTDGKIISEDEEANVVLDDPCNKMRLFLFSTKVEKRFDAPSLRYAANVLQWFKSSEKALEQQGYHDPLSEKFAKTMLEQLDKVRIHRFSRLVDRYIATRGVVGKVPSRIPGHDEEIAVAIPGYIECYESGEQRPCLFAYLIDKVTHVCFHRNVEFRIGQKLIADFFNKGSFEVEFPSFDWRRN